MLDYEYLLHLVSCAVNDLQPKEKPEGVSFLNVFTLGKAHEVANIAYLSVERLKAKPEKELYEEWKIYYYLAVQRDMRQRLAYEEITEALHKNRIRTLEAQGTVTKTLYPSSELRMMSDIDLIIDFENLEAAKGIMQSLGYSTSQKQEGEFDAVLEDGFLVEFHTEFFAEYMFNRKERYYEAINTPFSHAVEESPMRYVLNDDYYFLFTVIHTIVHFETAGCGIRRILDLFYLKKAYDGRINRRLVDEIIDKNELRSAYDKLFALEAKWFENVPSPIDLSETEADIINSGNHGVSEIFIRNNVRKDEREGVKFARLKQVYGFVFPPKEFIYLNYPECRERGYSTLRCRLYRVYKTLKRFSFSHALGVIKTMLKSK